jgi:tetratricopeptide (TPR) repeat protein
VQSLKETGNELFKKKKFSEAIDIYSKCLEIDPTNYLVLSNRSICYSMNKDHARALADAAQVVKLNSNWSKVKKKKQKQNE